MSLCFCDEYGKTTGVMADKLSDKVFVGFLTFALLLGLFMIIIGLPYWALVGLFVLYAIYKCTGGKH